MFKIFNFKKNKNIYYSLILQIANYVFPLITIPYTFRVLGPNIFGMIAFSTTFIGYLALVTDFGFNVSATKEIAMSNKSDTSINEIFSSVVILKIILLSFTFIILIICCYLFEKFSYNKLLYMISFGSVIGQVFFPVWLFQSLEKMGYVTIINILVKSLSTLAIFIFLKTKEDYLFLPIFNSCGFILSSIIALLFLNKLNIKFVIPHKSVLISSYKKGLGFFYMSIFTNIYSNSTTLLLGFFTTFTNVGYFSGADSIIKAVKGLYAAGSTAIFPKIVKQANIDINRTKALIKKIALNVSLLMTILFFVLFFFAELIIKILLGTSFQNSVILLKIMAILPLLIAVGNVYSTLGLISFGYEKIAIRFISIISIFNLIYLFPLSYFFSEIGASISLVITEFLITIFSIYFFYKKISNASYS